MKTALTDLSSTQKQLVVEVPAETVESAMDRVTRSFARKARLPVAADFGDFWRDFEWMGLQRHLKVLGIFARLYHRDGKDRYLADMPRVLAYVLRTARRYNAFAGLAALVERAEGTQASVGYTF